MWVASLSDVYVILNRAESWSAIDTGFPGQADHGGAVPQP